MLVLFLGAFGHKNQYYGKVIRPIITENFTIITNYINSLGSIPPKLFIDIKMEDLNKLAYSRQRALNHGQLIVNDDDYVNSRLTYNNKEYKVKLRLKGDHVDHLDGDKWSYRIKIKGDNTLFGMKQFSIHHPKTRNYIYEWIYHKALQNEDVISLRYIFINVSLNGKDLGIYALEEHFDKRLLENNERKEGPIIRFNEDLMWDELAQNKSFTRQNSSSKRVSLGYGDYFSSNVDAFHTNKILNDSIMFNNFQRAFILLESFRNGTISTKEVFDVDKLTSFLAITDLMGCEHGSRWLNTRFYYNPITGLLEPIGFDGNSNQFESLVYKLYLETDPKNFTFNKFLFYNTIFTDLQVYENYIHKLELFSKREYLNAFFEKIDIDLDYNLKLIYKEWPWFNYDKEMYYNSQRYIESVLSPKKALHAYIKSVDESGVELSFGSIQPMHIEVLNLTVNDSIVLVPNDKIIILGKKSYSLVSYVNKYFKIPGWNKIIFDESNLSIQYRLYGTRAIRKTKVFPWEIYNKEVVTNISNKASNEKNDYDLFLKDEANKIIKFKPGLNIINNDIYIPAGYTLFANGDVTIDIINSSKIVSNSPIIFTGSEESALVIQSSDSSGQGILISQTNNPSIMKFVTVSNLYNISTGGESTSGAITFYEADVEIRNCTFNGNKSEDALNIIRSEFLIDETVFLNSQSDAFDGDFVKGKINASSFNYCGNDAIDISGSIVNVQNISINKAGDKGISIGENSSMTGRNIIIRNSEIGIACKDLSEINISRISIDSTRVGYTAFQKKPEFGTAKITVSNSELKNFELSYLIEKGSTMITDQGKINNTDKDIEKILYGNIYGQNSK